jgi:hypothetical protein
VRRLRLRTPQGVAGRDIVGAVASMPDPKRLRRSLLVAGSILWLTAFALPSARWESLGRLQVDPGYVVARDSFQALLGWLSAPRGESPGWEAEALMLAWAANLLVPAFCRFRGVLPRMAVVLGLLLAWFPVVTGLRPNLWVGFYVWAGGLTLLGCGSWVARRGATYLTKGADGRAKCAEAD